MNGKRERQRETERDRERQRERKREREREKKIQTADEGKLEKKNERNIKFSHRNTIIVVKNIYLINGYICMLLKVRVNDQDLKHAWFCFLFLLDKVWLWIITFTC